MPESDDPVHLRRGYDGGAAWAAIAAAAEEATGGCPDSFGFVAGSDGCAAASLEMSSMVATANGNFAGGGSRDQLPWARRPLIAPGCSLIALNWLNLNYCS